MLALISVLILSSCDPVYRIGLLNTTNDTIRIMARTTIHFHTDDVRTTILSGPYEDEWIEFSIGPNAYVNCGTAIAGIQDEMPFTELKVYVGQDSIIANTTEEVTSLFEKNFWGNLKTPYKIIIE